MGSNPGIRQRDLEAELERLAANAEAGQWSAARSIDWRHAPHLPFWISRNQACTAISQLYHGELATARFCHGLLRDLKPGPARRCLEWQLADEERHAEVYRRYLDQLGGVAPIEPALARALDAAARGPAGELGTMVAYHVVVEGEVLRLQGLLARFLPCPLLKQINRRIARDEARHVAFGRVFLAAALAESSEAARKDLYVWLRETWRQCIHATLQYRSGNSTVRAFLQRWLQGGWERHAAALHKIGLTTGPRPLSTS